MPRPRDGALVVPEARQAGWTGADPRPADSGAAEDADGDRAEDHGRALARPLRALPHAKPCQRVAEDTSECNWIVGEYESRRSKIDPG